MTELKQSWQCWHSCIAEILSKTLLERHIAVNEWNDHDLAHSPETIQASGLALLNTYYGYLLQCLVSFLAYSSSAPSSVALPERCELARVGNPSPRLSGVGRQSPSPAYKQEKIGNYA